MSNSKQTSKKGGGKKKGQQLRTTTKKKRMLEALRKNLGIIRKACDAADVPRRTHYHWMDTDPDYAKAVEDIEEDQIDEVKDAMIKGIKEDRDPRLINQYLRTKAAHHGFREDVNIDINKGEPIPITFGGQKKPAKQDREKDESDE